MSIFGYTFWALCSGALGAAASCFAKLAFAGMPEPSWTEEDSPGSTCPDPNEWMTCFGTAVCAFQWISCHSLTVLLPRIAYLIAMIICNISMVACFVGGLQDAGSVAGTALATAANFLVSAAAGYFIWKEGNSISVPGLSMVVVGTILLVLAQMPEDNAANDSADKINANTTRLHTEDKKP